MMRTWISGFIRKNKEKITKAIKTIVLVIISIIVIAMILTSLQTLYKNDENFRNEIYTPEKTAIGGKNVTENIFKEDSEIIEEFVKNCNEGNVSEAYNLLTNECKETLYPTLERFTENYYKNVFVSKREHNLQSWINDKNCTTYRVRMIEDIMATGNYEESRKVQDYITVITNGGDKKININSYIKQEEINKKTETDELSILVTKKDVYMDYEKYTLVVTNKTEEDILLDSLKNMSETLVLESGFNRVEYKVYANEINRMKLTIEDRETKEISIKFTKTYNLREENQYINFKNIITNINEYKENEKEYEAKTVRIEV